MSKTKVIPFVFHRIDKSDDYGLNITVRPEASMTFFKAVSNEDVSGREVKLSDALIMVLQLKTEYQGTCS